MQFSELRRALDEGNLEIAGTAIDPNKLSPGPSDEIVYDGKVALPIFHVSCNYDKSLEIAITAEDNDLSATLLTCKSQQVISSSCTENAYHAYLTEVDVSMINQDYFFQTHHLLLPLNQVDLFLRKYKPGSAVWGGFIADAAQQTYLSNPISIQATELEIPTPFHSQASTLAITSSDAFHRFLKYYHLVELLTDYVLVDEIKSLGSDLRGISRILSQLKSQDYERLLTIIKKTCTDVKPLVDSLNKLGLNAILAKQVLIEFDKDSNPLGKKPGVFEAMINAGDFSETSMATHKLIAKDRSPERAAEHLFLVQKLSAYTIYRIRSSIAHNKIGEFLLEASDEQFIVECCEPLLLAVVRQVLQK